MNDGTRSRNRLTSEQIAQAKSLDLDVLLAAAAFKLGLTEADLRELTNATPRGAAPVSPSNGNTPTTPSGSADSSGKPGTEARHLKGAPASETRDSITASLEAKIVRDAATIKTLRLLLREAHDFLNAQVVLPEDYADFEARYKAFTESMDRLAAGVAFITDERLGGP